MSPAPLLTLKLVQGMQAARSAGLSLMSCSLDLQRTTVTVTLEGESWSTDGCRYPYPQRCRERTIYHWQDGSFEPVARFGGALIKLVPTDWGPPTFEIDGIKMLPTAHVSPYADAGRKVGLIEPRGKVILDTCGGLGYFAAWCLQGQAAQVLSHEKNPDVIWLRGLNPWSPRTGAGLTLAEDDIVTAIAAQPGGSVDAVLHDPPRFGIAGELYSQVFYQELARVLRRGGKLFHYTGTPNRLTSARDVPNEVATRLRRAGFTTRFDGDGVLGVKS